MIGKAGRQRSLDFLVMQCNLIGEYLDQHPEAFDLSDVNYLRPKLEEIRSELMLRNQATRKEKTCQNG